MGLGDVAGGVDLAVHGEHRTFALGLRIDGDADCVQQIARAVEVGFRGVALGADQDHGLVGIDGEVEPVGGFFQGVGAVGDDDAGHLGASQRGVDVARQRRPAHRVHVIRGDVGDVFHLDGGVLRDLRHGGQQVLTGNRRHRRVLDGVDLHGDGAAGCNEHDHRLRLGGDRSREQAEDG